MQGGGYILINPLSYINQAMTDTKTSISELSDKTGIRYELLRRTLHGKRKMTAQEFVTILDSLNFKITIK